MALSVSVLSVCLFMITFIVHRLWSRYQSNKKYKFPNVVPGWPLVGNSFDLPFPGGMWSVETARKYGEMYTLYLGGRAVVFLNSSRVVNDLLERRAPIYASRPYRPMAQGIMSGNARMVLMPMCDRLRDLRKLMHSILNNQQAETKFVACQELESKQLVYDFFLAPENFHLAIQRFSNSVIMSVVFGRRAAVDDPAIKAILDSVTVLNQYMFSYVLNICDTFTWLEHLPRFLQWWRPSGEAYFKRVCALYRGEHDRLLAKIENGTARPCVGVQLEQGGLLKEFSLTETEKLFVYATLLEAGSDTSRNAITQTVAAMAAYPAWVQTARSMLDSVCGANAERLPSFSDRERLPYITAAAKEALRWRPFIQTGVPHVLTQDDEYEGYKFPAGTQFTWNAYAIALSEENYEDALAFKPERFLDGELGNPLKGHWQFGTGRRVCLGATVGHNNIWIAIAVLIYCFDITADPDHPIDTLTCMWDVHKEAPFKVNIKPRSQAHIDLIKRVGAEALNADY